MTQLAQICVMIPLTVEDLDEDITAQDIITTLQSAAELRDVKAKAQNAIETLHVFGKGLDHILDTLDDPFAKAKALRQLAKEMKEWE